jgi:sigma-B regulation protein RsbU (phosphoserine phosphatase)
MPLSDFLHDLRQIEKTVPAQHGALILDAFRRHTPFATGAVYFSDGDSLRLAAKSQHCHAPDVVGGTVSTFTLDPAPSVLVPIRSHRDDLGVVALIADDPDLISDGDLEVVRTAEAFLSTVIVNQRLLQEAREGDFQLKYRLWELESLYDIGLSIASTLNIDELADAILFRMISLTNARRGALLRRDGASFRPYRTFADLELDEAMLERVLLEARPISADGAVVAVPIIGNNTIIGVLAAADRETRDGGVGAFEENDLRLLSLFASQVAIALENSRLHREALEKQAMERELELAATIQRDILPKAIPEMAGLEIAALSRPARQVGGDYHAFFERDGVMSMLVADVAGKSMPAALLVSALHAVVQLLFAEGRELGEIATELNKHIHRWSAENKFVTMIMASIDRDNGVLEFVNAGHNPGYVVCGDRIDQLRSHGLPVGILEQTRYSTQIRSFPAGSTVVLYSDGITEAESVAGEEFENDRLEVILREAGDASSSVIRDRIAAAVDEFTAGAPQKDDQTVVIARSL